MQKVLQTREFRRTLTHQESVPISLASAFRIPDSRTFLKPRSKYQTVLNVRLFLPYGLFILLLPQGRFHDFLGLLDVLYVRQIDSRIGIAMPERKPCSRDPQ